MHYEKTKDHLEKDKLFKTVYRYLEILKKVKFEDVVKYLYEPTDPSSLGIIRFLFGLLMVIDIVEERGGSEIDIRWGNPEDCHFPLFSILEPLSYPFMCLAYGIMWVGAVGITLGFQFRLSTFLFLIPYWYILLLDKTFWNNHSYLYGIVAILLMGSSANHFFSLDAVFNKNIRDKPIPYWNYFILKYQFFMLYFLAGLKKTDSEWLEGYSLTPLGEHWVFYPFRIILSTEQIDYLVVHWFGFLLDLTVGFWMLMEFSRPVAMVFCALFHLMNSRLFSIGMFPYVCLVTMPLFCKENWPRKIWKNIITQVQIKKEKRNKQYKIEPQNELINFKENQLQSKVKFRQKFVVSLLLTHMGLQVFLPYSHFITKGNNNWTNGLYGYSWDMMVHSWDTVLVVVKIVDNESGNEYFINSQAWNYNNRWSQHADMCLQYAHCIRRNLENIMPENRKNEKLSKNISIFIDVWCSLNKRFQQRMYNPNYDLMKANWSLFRPVEWLMPVLSEYNDFRRQMDEISTHVHSWNNESNVMFVADFPDMFLENYIGEELDNVSLTILAGKVIYEIENEVTMQSIGVKMESGDSISVPEGYYHKIHTISTTPSCYMYTFSKKASQDDKERKLNVKMYSPFPLIEDISLRNEYLLRMMGLVWNSTSHLLFGTPLEKPKINYDR